MKSNQQLKQEARAKYDAETRHEVILGGEIVGGKYFRYKNAYLNNKKRKKITTASIREEHGRAKINPKQARA